MPDDIHQLQESDIHISRVLHFMKEGRKPGYAEIKRDSLCVRRMLRKFSQMHLVDGILFRKYLDNGEVTQLVIIESPKSLVLQQLHDAVGHQGKERTGALVRSRCYWPSMYQDIAKWSEDCSRCFTAKEQFLKVKARMYHLSKSTVLHFSCRFHTPRKVNIRFRECVGDYRYIFQVYHSCTNKRPESKDSCQSAG